MQTTPALAAWISSLGKGPAPHATGGQEESINLSKLFRALVAGWGAKKLGGGCFGTVLIFIILWWLLGHFGIFQ